MMTRKPRADDAAANLSRRSLLGAGAIIPAVMAAGPAPAAEPMAEMPPSAAPGDTPPAIPDIEGLEVLNAREADILEAFCARLIPTDENGPGAKEARAAHYIDRALGGAMRGQREAYAIGLSALDAYARAARGKGFADLAAADQDAVLHDLEANKADGFVPDSASFFAMVRQHTIHGTFSDPYYGGNYDFIGWDMVGYPGIRMPVGPEDQSLIPPRRLRQSAYTTAMFGRGTVSGS
jgi:gluconate 2-dehydrogenase gamma chain